MLNFDHSKAYLYDNNAHKNSIESHIKKRKKHILEVSCMFCGNKFFPKKKRKLVCSDCKEEGILKGSYINH